MSNVQNSQANQTHSHSTKLFLILSFILFNLPFSIGQDSTNYEIIYDLPNGKQVVNKDGKVGMIDARSKKVVVPFEYDFSKNLGIIDGFVELLKGSSLIIVTKIQYDTITYTTLPKEVKKKLMWGLLDTSGKVITPTIWSSIAPFQDKKAVVSLETLNGLINDQGLIILPAIYYDIKRLDNGNYLAALQKRGYYDCEIRNRSMNTLWFTDSLDRRVYSKGMDNPNYLGFRRKDNEGIIDINGKIIIAAIFKYVLSIKANER